MQKLTPAREAQINAQMAELSAKFGIKRAVANAPLLLLYQKRDYPGLVREIRNSFGLNHLRVNIRYPELSRNERTMAHIQGPGALPPVAAFPIRRPQVTLHLVMKRVRHISFANTVRTLAHELAHPLLWAEFPSLKEERSEFATDLTAMMFGYHNFFTDAHSAEEVLGQYGFADIPELASLKSVLMSDLQEEEELTNAKYLTSAEIQYAAEVIRRCVL